MDDGHRIGATVDQREPTLPSMDEDGVPLADVEHDDAVIGQCLRTAQDEDEHQHGSANGERDPDPREASSDEEAEQEDGDQECAALRPDRGSSGQFEHEARQMRAEIEGERHTGHSYRREDGRRRDQRRGDQVRQR